TARVGRGLRRLRRDLKQRLGQIATVRFVAWDTIEVSLLHGVRSRRYPLGGSAARTHRGGTLHVEVPSPAEFDLLAASGVLQGGIRVLRVRIAEAPSWLRAGLRSARPSRDSTLLRWQAWRDGVEITLSWRSRRNVARALAEASGMLLRPRRLDQTGGPVHASDRETWLRGHSTWPHAVLDARPSADHGPFTTLPSAGPGRPERLALPVCTAVAGPHARTLSGEATPYTVVTRPDSVVLRTRAGNEVLGFSTRTPIEARLLRPGWDKYAVAEVPTVPPAEPFVTQVLTALGACGVVFASRADDVRSRLSDLGLEVVDDPAHVSDLHGYQHSLAASRSAAIRADPVLRHTALAYRPGRLPLPTISVLIASKRASDVLTCLEYFTGQTYPAYEVIVGTHGYVLDDADVAELRARLAERDVPLRLVPIPEEHTLGEVLGTLSRRADGELLAKVDDDDHYGPEHLTDLLLASRSSGADLVAKSARFVHLADDGVTVDRTWAAVEAFDVMPAGGTLMLSRAVLQSCGGWSTSPRHVDADLLTRIRSIGGVTYRTHGLGYVYVRRGEGHTWQADSTALRESGELLYDGLPTEVLSGGPLCR
ncbi:MAG TPA: glycosyltransferase family A protein, partial [Actinopolymorphaceae bacterium]